MSRHYRWATLLLGFAALATATSALARERDLQADACDARVAAVTEPLSLAGAVYSALCGNPEVAAAVAARDEAVAARDLAHAARLPAMSATVSRWVDGPASSTSLGTVSQVEAEVTAFDFGQRRALVRSEAAGVQSRDAAYRERRLQLALRATETFLDLRDALARVDAARADQEARARALALARAQERVGTGTRADVLRAESAVHQSSLAIIRAEAQVAADRAALAAVIAEPVTSTTALDASLEATVALPTDGATELAVRARDANAALAEARARVSQSELAALAEERRARPSLSVASSYDRSSRQRDDSGSAVALRVSVPLTSFEQKQRANRARAAARRVRAELASEEASLDAQVHAHVAAAAAADGALDAAQALALSAGEAARVAEGRFAAGVGTLNDLLDALAVLANARVDVIVAESDITRTRGRVNVDLGEMPVRMGER